MAFVSLHTAEPSFQGEHEVSYKGYHRIEMDYFEGCAKKPIDVIFPEIEQGGNGEITHIAIGTAEVGRGDLLLQIHSMPYIPIQQGSKPRIIITDIYPYPETLNPIAKIVHYLVGVGEMKAEDLHPALYEAINESLHGHGVPVIPVVRSGVGDLKQVAGWGLNDL